jgi:hypothetical protein
MHQVTFKYSLLKDFQNFFEIFGQRKWLKEQGIKFFWPSFFRLIKIIFRRPKIVFSTDIPVVCYFVSNGTWGAYEHPDRIIIMPFDLPEDMTLEELIGHEIAHLKHPEADSLEHAEKEKYIDKQSDENITNNQNLQ